MSDFDPDYWGARIRAAAQVVPKGEAVMGEKMTLKEAVLQAEPHRMMRGDSGRYPDGTCWGQTSSVDGFWLPLEAWQTVMAHITQPAQAVDMEHEMVLAFRAGAKWADEHVAPDGRLIGKLLEPRALTVARASNEYAGERTAALPNANGKEGES